MNQDDLFPDGEHWGGRESSEPYLDMSDSLFDSFDLSPTPGILATPDSVGAGFSFGHVTDSMISASDDTARHASMKSLSGYVSIRIPYPY